jgi:hypothetical protein
VQVCDLISRWETCLREKGSGKFENTRAIRLHLRLRLYWASETKHETERERLLICFQINEQIKHGMFPVSKNLALELTALMAQVISPPRLKHPFIFFLIININARL